MIQANKHTLFITSIILISIGVSLYVFIFIPPFGQDKHYHCFADANTFLHIPNFYNVLSNIPFLIVGSIGLYKLHISKTLQVYKPIKGLYTLLFFSLILVAFGSGYYHLNPNNTTLLWDRLPMTIGFMALFSIVIGEFISVNLARNISLILILLGLSSVAYWYITQAQNQGDLRLYVLVQYLPMLIIPLILLLFKGRYTHTRGYVLLLVFYFLAKLCEHFDEELYRSFTFISGHSIKHLFAALAPYFLLLSYEKRTIRKASSE